jgi:hypothetical protein
LEEVGETDVREENRYIETKFLAMTSAAFATFSWHSVCVLAETSSKQKIQADWCCINMCIIELSSEMQNGQE